MSLPQFKLLRPRTVEEAVSLLAKHSGRVAAADSPARAPSHKVRIVAGGTDLIPSMRQKLFDPQYVLDIRHIAELKGIREQQGSGVEIGALTSLTTVERSNVLRRRYPVLTEAAATVASPLLRNMGTIGGNICLDTRCLWYNQSLTWRKGCGFCIKKDGDLCHVAPGGNNCWAAFSGDTPPALLCLNAEIEIASASGLKRVSLRDFYTGDGVAYRTLQPNELVTRVFLPESAADYRGVYRKLRVRGSIDYPLAGVAIVMKRSNGHVVDARVAVTAVNPAPLLVKGASELLAGKIIDEALAEAVGNLAARTAKPLTTSALTPEYRREMIRVFTKRAVLAANN
ncbi:MAG TPA: FAD binding domain-containing protein [Terriglobales bacterium]|nr:FAD binding domain-containing protein [Terriglobales bacterium]